MSYREGSTRAFTVSVPPAMMKSIEAVRYEEHRTRSELVREALRVYFRMRSAVAPTLRESAVITRGREEIARGRFVTLDELDRTHRSKRRKRGRSG